MDLVCKACNELFDGESSFIDHFMDKHTVRESIDDLSIHNKYKEPSNRIAIQQSTNQGAFSSSICVCEICYKSTSDINTLAAHILTHVGAMPYFCETCEFSTISKLHLKQHLFRHMDEAAKKMIEHYKFEDVHECEGCNCHFPTWKDLVCHYVHHLKSMPFTCKECCMMFSEKRDYTIHNHLHKYSLICDICHGFFNTRVKLLLHVLTHDTSKYFCKFSNLVNVNFKNIANSHISFQNNLKINRGVSDARCSEPRQSFASDKAVNNIKRPLFINVPRNKDLGYKKASAHRLEGVSDEKPQKFYLEPDSLTEKGMGYKPPVFKRQRIDSKSPQFNQSELLRKVLPNNLSKKATRMEFKKTSAQRLEEVADKKSPKSNLSSGNFAKKDTDCNQLTVKNQRSNILNKTSSPINEFKVVRKTLPGNLSKKANMAVKTKSKHFLNDSCADKNSDKPKSMKTLSIVMQRLPSYVRGMPSYRKYCRVQKRRILRMKKNSLANRQKASLQKQSKQVESEPNKHLVTNTKFEYLQSNKYSSQPDDKLKNSSIFDTENNVDTDSHCLNTNESCGITQQTTTEVFTNFSNHLRNECKKYSSLMTEMQSKHNAISTSIVFDTTIFKNRDRNLVSTNCSVTEKLEDQFPNKKLLNADIKLQEGSGTALQPLSECNSESVEEIFPQSLPDRLTECFLIKNMKQVSILLDKLPSYVTDMLSYKKYAEGEEIETKSKRLVPQENKTFINDNLKLEGSHCTQDTKTKTLIVKGNNYKHLSNQKLMTSPSIRTHAKYWYCPRDAGRNEMKCSNYELTEHEELTSVCSSNNVKESDPNPESVIGQESLLKNDSMQLVAETPKPLVTANQKPMEYYMPGTKKKRIGTKSNYLKQITAQKLIRTSQILKEYSKPKKCVKTKEIEFNSKMLFNKSLLTTRKAINSIETSFTSKDCVILADKERNGMYGHNTLRPTVQKFTTENLPKCYDDKKSCQLSGNPISEWNDPMKSSNPDVKEAEDSPSDSSDSSLMQLLCKLPDILPCDTKDECPEKVENKKPRKKKRLALADILPCTNVVKRHNKKKKMHGKKKLMNHKSISRSNSVFPRGQEKPKGQDLIAKNKNIRPTRIQRRISKIRKSLKRLRSRNSFLCFTKCRKLVVELCRLPDSIYQKHLKGKPIMLSNMMPVVQSVRSLPTKQQEHYALDDHNYFLRSADPIMLEHNYAKLSNRTSRVHLNFRNNFSLSI